MPICSPGHSFFKVSNHSWLFQVIVCRQVFQVACADDMGHSKFSGKIIDSTCICYFRNQTEFTFSKNQQWLTDIESNGSQCLHTGFFPWKLRNCIQYETQYYICMNIDHLNICFTYLRHGFKDALCLFNYIQVKKQSFITTKGVKCSLTTSEWIVTGKAITKLTEKIDSLSDIKYKGILSRNSASDLIVVWHSKQGKFASKA